MGVILIYEDVDVEAEFNACHEGDEATGATLVKCRRILRFLAHNKLFSYENPCKHLQKSHTWRRKQFDGRQNLDRKIFLFSRRTAKFRFHIL